MTKCDFCGYSSPRGKCYWSAQSVRIKYCKDAVKQMVKAFQGSGNKTMRTSQ